MASFKKHLAAPVVQPPATYDLLGLTEDQFYGVMALCGRSTRGGPLEGIYTELYRDVDLPMYDRMRYRLINRPEWRSAP